MQTAAQLIKIAHSFVIISLFGGMLLVAGLTVFALSPVSYEDYQAWKQSELDNSPLAEQGAVAGAFSEDNPVSVSNLLEGKDVAYTTAYLGDSYQFYFEVGSAQNLPILRIHHQNSDRSNSTEDYLVCLSPQSANASSYGLTTNNMSQLLELTAETFQLADVSCGQNYLVRLNLRESQELRFTGSGKYRVKITKLAEQADLSLRQLP
jgi:hypothetical protein